LADRGYSFIILSDRNANVKNLPIPSLLACSSVHHHLVRVKKRAQVALVIETAEACEVMHFALLFGYGASAVNPYGAFATIYDIFNQGRFPNISNFLEAENNFIEALHKGLLKILSKLGISTLRSYHGAQTFEALGLSEKLIETHFTGTNSRIGGVDLPEIAQETLLRHHLAYIEQPYLLPSEGIYQYRKDGEKHAWNPETIAYLQWAVRSKDYEKYKQFSQLVNKQNQQPHVIRGLLEFNERQAIPLNEVEPAPEILKRFTTGAMSFGSLGEEIHETIAVAMNTIGGPQRY
jgi:glutamate synthase (NADPH/NADH) large chain